MPTLSAPGLGSGLDIQGIISQLMAVERQPLNQLESRKAEFQAQLSAYGQLKSAVSSFQSALADLDTVSDFKLYSATSGDETLFTASASSSASPASYGIRVDALAEAHKMGSSAFADKDTTLVGNAGDTLDITVNGNSFTVDIGAKTLEQIRDAINGASDNVGVSASIIQENSSSFRLVLTSDDTGTANAISLAFKDSGGSAITDPLGMSTINAAVDASLLIDGTYTITRSSNTITDAIEGVTLNLLKTDTAETTLEIKQDTQGVADRVQAFVDAYNSLQATFGSLSEGALDGDSTIRTMESQFRTIFNTAPSGLTTAMTALSELGIRTERDGTLSLDSATLNDALATDFDGVAELLGDDDQGFAFRLKALADEILGTDGAIETRTDGVNSRIDTLDDRISNWEFRLEKIEARYRAQFTALDTLLSGLQATSDFLSQQLGSLSASS